MVLLAKNTAVLFSRAQGVKSLEGPTYRPRHARPTGPADQVPRSHVRPALDMETSQQLGGGEDKRPIQPHAQRKWAKLGSEQEGAANAVQCTRL